MKRIIALTSLPVLLAAALVGAAEAAAPTALAQHSSGASAVADWIREAQRAIVPRGPNGIFGSENYGNKFPGEAAVYMGIVHAAMFDAAVAIEGGYRPYAIELHQRGASPEAAVATATHHTLVGLQPALGLTAAQQDGLNARYASYIAAIPEGSTKANGIQVGEQVADAVLSLRNSDGREQDPQYGQPPLVPLAPGPGVWDPGAAPAVGLRMPGIRPLVLESVSQFRPDGPEPLGSRTYSEDFAQVKELGRADSSARTPQQTEAALFWTDHDPRQWNDALLNLAAARDLDLVRTARMLAMAHVSGGDAMLGCFDAKYTYWFWRPYQAIQRAGTDGNTATESDASWQPLRPTPNFPEYPSAHACHSTAVVEVLKSFFGTNNIPISINSRITGTTRYYDQLQDVVKDVNRARVLAGFHFRNSDQEGSNLGRTVGRYVADHVFEPVP